MRRLHMSATFLEQRIRKLHCEVDGAQDKLFAALNNEFGWDLQECYMATEFLYRPENMN